MRDKSQKILEKVWSKIREHDMRAKIRQMGTGKRQSSSSAQDYY
jgi:hypothetical protein